MKNRNAKLLCLALVLALVLTIALAACNPKAETPDALVKSLKTSLKNYLASEEFTTAKSAASTQDRVPLMYSRYIIGNIYTDADAELLKTNLQKIDSVIDKNGNLSDELYDKEGCPLYTKSSYEWNGVTYESKNGWQSIVDYAYSWSLMYNQYKQYLSQANKTDETFDDYDVTIVNYLKSVDSSDTFYGTAYGYDKASSIVLTLANLAYDPKNAPVSYNALLSYYDKDKDKDGNFTKYVGNPNWIGFTGRPLASGSLMRGEEKYSLVYEKTMQGIYPYDDTKADAYYNYKIDDMINLDRLYDDYGKEIVSQYGSIGDSRYGILYGYLNGIDMTKYTKSVDDGKTYNVLQKWVDSLKKDSDGNYVLADGVDMAVAICYVYASKMGLDTPPTPIGSYSSAVSVLSLD